MAEPDPLQAIRPMTAAAVELAAAVPDEAEAVTQVLLHLNQLSAILAGHVHAGDVDRVLHALYRQLARLAATGPAAAARVQTLLDLLNQLAAEGRIHAIEAPSLTGRRRGRPAAPRYSVRQGARGERLVEHREGAEKDFYVTRVDFDAAIDALARTARPEASFDPLHKAFLAAGGSPIKSAYPLRVVLRFLRHHHPPLITGQRGRYSLTAKPDAFRKQARKAWTITSCSCQTS